MYLLTWNEEDQSIVAGIGGVVTPAEAAVLMEEIEALLDSQNTVAKVELDASRVTRFQSGAFEALEKMRFLVSKKGSRLDLITTTLTGELSLVHHRIQLRRE
jgi:ABC-type transporter Mla MlaB component